MATRTFCDRCDRQTDVYEVEVNVTVVSDKYTVADMCERCIDQLLEWLKPLPKEASDVESR